MKFVYVLTILSLLLLVGSSFSGSIPVDDPGLFKQAIDYLNAVADADTMILTVSGGVYTTHDTSEYNIIKPLTILAAPGLAEKPIITHSDDSTNVIRMFQCYNSLTIQGCVIDGGHELSYGLKHGVTIIPDPDGIYSIKPGLNLTFKDCDFINFFQDKDPTKEGHALYFYREIPLIGTVRFEGCTFKNIMDEAIRMTETEKYATTRVLDSLIVRNCTFENIDAECIRFYGDKDTETPDAVVLIENCTVNNCAPRFTYLKNNAGSQVRNIIVTNGRMSVRRPDRNDYVMQIQGVGSHVSHVDTLNLVFNPDAKKEFVVDAVKGGAEDLTTLWGFDPMYVDAANGDFTLKPESHAYYSGLGGVALGDLRWATNAPTVIPFTATIEGDGSLIYDPEKEGQVFDPGTTVSITAVPDSGWSFSGWSGDLTGSDNPATITVNAATSITAIFVQGSAGVAANFNMPQDYALGQNYPNPFNPSTSIPFTLKKAGTASLEIYNLQGQKVATVFNRRYKAGSHNAFFSADGLAAGVYIYSLTAGDFVANKKLVLIK